MPRPEEFHAVLPVLLTERLRWGRGVRLRPHKEQGPQFPREGPAVQIEGLLTSPAVPHPDLTAGETSTWAL